MGCPSALPISTSGILPQQNSLGFYRSRVQQGIKLDHDCIWDAAQERDWRERRFLRVEKEGFRDPVRGKSGTVR